MKKTYESVSIELIELELQDCVAVTSGTPSVSAGSNEMMSSTKGMI